MVAVAVFHPQQTGVGNDESATGLLERVDPFPNGIHQVVATDGRAGSRFLEHVTGVEIGPDHPVRAVRLEDKRFLVQYDLHTVGTALQLGVDAAPEAGFQLELSLPIRLVVEPIRQRKRPTKIKQGDREAVGSGVRQHGVADVVALLLRLLEVVCLSTDSSRRARQREQHGRCEPAKRQHVPAVSEEPRLFLRHIHCSPPTSTARTAELLTP